MTTNSVCNHFEWVGSSGSKVELKVCGCSWDRECFNHLLTFSLHLLIKPLAWHEVCFLSYCRVVLATYLLWYCGERNSSSLWYRTQPNDLLLARIKYVSHIKTRCKVLGTINGAMYLLHVPCVLFKEWAQRFTCKIFDPLLAFDVSMRLVQVKCRSSPELSVSWILWENDC